MFRQEVADAICAAIASGASLRKAAHEQGVAAPTVIDWVNARPDFSEQYARAREKGYALLADEIIEISDDSSSDVVETEHGQKTDAEVVARSRLRVDSRKWILSKMLPKVYGEKITTDITGKLQHEHTGGLSAETERLLAGLKARGSGASDAEAVPD